MTGTLFIVATPIGNLLDISERAKRTLAAVALVAAEDTRHSAQLLAQYGLHTPLTPVHEHNEAERVAPLIDRLQSGEDIALISDAGTPLMSDPGYRLVAAAAAAGVPVVPVPGACAAIAALSVAGLPTDRFAFEGFLPPKSTARRGRLNELKSESRTLVFYETPHRIADTLADLESTFGADRRVVVARELTKMHESVYRGTVSQLIEISNKDQNFGRGEIVLVVDGAAPAADQNDVAQLDDPIAALLPHAPLGVIADVISTLAGVRRNAVYERALALKRAGTDST